MKLPPPRLCIADDATFWPWFTWPDFSEWPNKDDTLVVVPLAGLADWGLGQPLDAEETLLMHVLRAASRRREADLRMLVIPPLRFALGPEPGCAFAVDPEVLHGLIDEVAGSVASAGFRRIVLLNSSPWNEELCRAAGRDIRIARGLQMFCIHLSGLGLDLHPIRGGDRHAVRAILDSIAAGGIPPDSVDADDEAEGSGPGAAALASAARHLVSLLGEIRARPALPNFGVLKAVSAS
jgi:creatinine amidohydrolase